MHIHKFGGASIGTNERLDNAIKIIDSNVESPALIIVSAMGKTTNTLEKVVETYFNGQIDDSFALLNELKNQHYSYCSELFGEEELENLKTDLNDTFVEIEWMIEERSNDPYNYIYDQIVSVGELISSKIFEALLRKNGSNSIWLDVRDVLKTDNNYRNASVDWKTSQELINDKVKQLSSTVDIIVTQGFIACTSENFTTTLGREGSDFSAAIFASCLSANSMTVWKDVPGIMTADPSLDPAASLLSKLSYEEALAMTYYGAKVIHPKTIKPIQNKSIPLRVKSFLSPKDEGTVISHLEQELRYPPITVVEENNIFVKLKSLDNSFIRVERLADIFGSMKRFGLVLKVDRNTPDGCEICMSDPYKNYEKFVEEIQDKFTIEALHNCELVTVRHGDESEIAKTLGSKKIILKELSQNTIRYILN